MKRACSLMAYIPQYFCHKQESPVLIHNYMKYLTVPRELKNLYHNTSIHQNRLIFLIISVTFFTVEFISIISILFFSSLDLSTPRNRSYFYYCCFFFFSAAFYLLLHKFFQDKKVLQFRLHHGAFLFWLAWSSVLNTCHFLFHDGMEPYILMLGFFVLSAFVLLEPAWSIPSFIAGCILFIVMNLSFMTPERLGFLFLITALSISLSLLRFRQTVTLLELRKKISDTDTLIFTEQEKLKLSLEKHRIIFNQTNDILLEWDIEEDKVLFSKNWNLLFGHPLTIPDFQNWILGSANLSQTSKKTILEAMYNCRTGTSYEECEFDFLYPPSGRTEWFQLRISVQYDDCYRPVTGIGILINIHDRKTELIQLRSLAQEDPLTGLLNKNAMQEYGEDSLSHTSPEHPLAMFIVDLDNFKKVNDTYGHPCGDYVLTQAAQCMREIFHNAAGLGRIGGDEFAIIFSDFGSNTELEEKAELLLRKITCIRWKKKNPGASCSIGIALAAAPGISYEQLYHQTDAALYKAKQFGKNCYYL